MRDLHSWRIFCYLDHDKVILRRNSFWFSSGDFLDHFSHSALVAIEFRFSPTQPWFGPPNFEKPSLALRLLTVFACVENTSVGGAIGGHAIFVSNAFEFADFAIGAPLKASELKVRFATVSPKTSAAVIGATVKTLGAHQRHCIWLKFLIGVVMSAGETPIAEDFVRQFGLRAGRRHDGGEAKGEGEFFHVPGKNRHPAIVRQIASSLVVRGRVFRHRGVVDPGLHHHLGTGAPRADLFGCVRPRSPPPGSPTHTDVGGPIRGRAGAIFLPCRLAAPARKTAPPSSPAG